MTEFNGHDYVKACQSATDNLKKYQPGQKMDDENRLFLLFGHKAAIYLWRFSLNQWAYERRGMSMRKTLWDSIYRSRVLYTRDQSPGRDTLEVRVLGWTKHVEGRGEEAADQMKEEFLHKVFYSATEPKINGIRFDVKFESILSSVPASKLHYEVLGKDHFVLTANPSILLGEILASIARDESGHLALEYYTPTSHSWRELRLLYHLQKAVIKRPNDAINRFLLVPKLEQTRTDLSTFIPEQDLQAIHRWLDPTLGKLKAQFSADLEAHRKYRQEKKEKSAGFSLLRKDKEKPVKPDAFKYREQLEVLEYFRPFLHSADGSALTAAHVQNEEHRTFEWFPTYVSPHDVQRRK
ncbi:uncharacterized protein JCM6883_006364 [Sporobolomyces salmoneus]|uniref:uncharacterized protein n=1 Tax=Sporobolomyces salmoneus TaxID=183962 RepID=UPI003173A1D0